MYDINKLEEEWKQYRRKKLRPLYIASLGFIALESLGSSFFNE